MLQRRYHPDSGSEADAKKSADINRAYDILTDPRADYADAWHVRDFYRHACESLQSADDEGVCMVSGTPFFERAGMAALHLPTTPRVLYSFAFSLPRAFVHATSNRAYPSTYRCCDVYADERICRESWGSEKANE